MPQRVEERIRPITPQLAWRVAVLGGLAFVLFGIVFFRLWYLQVLSGEQYLAQANSNRVRALAIPAPRGKIVDREGREIVRNKFAAVLEIDGKPTEIDAAGDTSVLHEPGQAQVAFVLPSTRKERAVSIAAGRTSAIAYEPDQRGDGKTPPRPASMHGPYPRSYWSSSAARDISPS